jgi:hypothetical protein
MPEVVSGTTLTTFVPVVPYQQKVVNLVRKDWDYSRGNLEILLSGSYGSAKSILMAHLAVTHCLFNPRSVVLLARKALPDLKETIFKEIIEHLDCDGLSEGVDYKVNTSTATIKFSNGSEIISRSWSDKRYKKGRSLKVSMLVFEELTENTEEDKEAFMTLKARLRRLPHVKENLLIAATNPDAPSHWVYRYFFDEKQETKHVFKSVTTDNPFLDPVYIAQLKQDLDPKSIQRYIYGEWVELARDQVYYNYDKERNFREKYEGPTHELRLCHDFNIGHGKPMSAAACYKVGNAYHAVRAYHVEGARTEDIMEEIAASGVLESAMTVSVYGDETGKNRDTRSIRSDYDIILKFLQNYQKKNGGKLQVKLMLPTKNPPIRRRHNLVNAHFQNDAKQVRLYLYDKWLDEGFRMTQFKKSADLVEDDTLPQQHVTTAIGYMIDFDSLTTSAGQSRTIQL